MTETVLVRGVLLDMDGTLVDSTPLVEAIWGEFAAAHDLDAREILSYSHGLPTISTVRGVVTVSANSFGDTKSSACEKASRLTKDLI